jgi:TM2 domain-containing membrane protein YozV
MGVKVTDSYPSSPKSRTVMAVLAWFTGYVGVHRFYAGRIPSGVAMAIVWVLGMCIYVPGIIFSMADDVFGRTTGFAAIETAARTSPVWFGVLLIIVGGLMVTGMEIWRLVDFVMVLLGRFRDGDGLPITRWLNNNTSSGVAAGGQVMTSSPASSPKSRLVTVLLAAFVGWLGIHCFYVGRTGRGVAMLILGIIILPVSSVWALVDLVFAITGQFRDRNNMLITDWQV